MTKDDPKSVLLKNKKSSKKNLCKRLSLDSKMPLITLVLDKELGAGIRELVERFLEGTSSLDVEIAVVADTNLDSFSFPHVHYIPYSEKSRKEILGAADIMVALPFNDLEEALLNGTIPVCHQCELANDYNPNAETGNSFVYGNAEAADHWKIFASLVRALETYKFPYDWKNIIFTGLSK
jgi:hypothetical protein